MSNASRELAERSELFGLDQAVLRGPQINQRLLGSILGNANSFLGTLTLRDIGIDQHEAAVGYWIAADLDNAAIGANPFVTHFAPHIFDAPRELHLEISRIELASGS